MVAGPGRCSTRRPASPPPTRVRRTLAQTRDDGARRGRRRQHHRRHRLPLHHRLDPTLAAIPVSGWGTYHDRLKIGGVKITIDGSPQGQAPRIHHALPDRRARRREELDGRADLPAGDDQRDGEEGLRPRRAAQPARQRRRGDRCFFTRPRVRRCRRSRQGPQRDDDPRAVHRPDQIDKYVAYKSGRRSTRCTPTILRRPTSPTAARSRRPTSARCATRSTTACARPTTPTSSWRRSTRCSCCGRR